MFHGLGVRLEGCNAALQFRHLLRCTYQGNHTGAVAHKTASSLTPGKWGCPPPPCLHPQVPTQHLFSLVQCRFCLLLHRRLALDVLCKLKPGCAAITTGEQALLRSRWQAGFSFYRGRHAPLHLTEGDRRTFAARIPRPPCGELPKDGESATVVSPQCRRACTGTQSDAQSVPQHQQSRRASHRHTSVMLQPVRRASSGSGAPYVPQDR